jgi:valyl-tRNA synthetase
MQPELAKSYEPHEIEARWGRWWVEQRLFEADPHSTKPVFSIVIPPPNVTGSLHMGHMLEHTEIDILVRWKRMTGYNTLWLPGTDHAGIATQVMVERQLAEEGLTRHQVGREEFLRRTWKWKEEHGDTIKRQMVRLGASCDWSRERFTMDAGLSRAVREVFVRLYEEGLIYRGRYIINWCPRCQTALSDLEVIHEEQQGKLWHIRYPLIEDGKPSASRFIVVATTRPETMLGDTAVAVHPDDERYRALHGRKVLLPLMEREIPLIADSFANPEFGSGAVKVTPAHDPNDFEIGHRHNLPQVDIMDDLAQMNQNAGRYAGLDRMEARHQIVADLEKQGLLEKVEPYTVPLGKCQRCRTVLEPRVSTQWFVKIGPLARPAIEVVRDGRIRFTPENYARDYFNWMENIHDWCISRQLWWGHRIPAWYCQACGQTIVAREAPEKCPCGGEVRQDPDVLDTWFSSGLWPFSTLGWPDQTEDLRVFYPTSVMVTGFDILFFWVARMVMMGVAFMKDVPFREVYIHALVRDAERQKMSKTKGNVIDPLEVTEKYGTDAVRFTLAIQAAPGTDIALSEERIQSYRAFANKIWNAARFIFMKGFEYQGQAPVIGSLEDRWMFSRLEGVAAAVNAALTAYRFHEAAYLVYHFFWHEFCDWYIELKKLDTSEPSWQNLLAAFERALRLLHPFMPFITEELWQRVTQKSQVPGPTSQVERPGTLDLGPGTGHSIALEPYPQADTGWRDEEAERRMAALQEAVVNIRNIRAEMKIEPKRRVPAEFYSPDAALRSLAGHFRPAFERLAGVSELALLSEPPRKEGGVLRHTLEFDVRVPLAGAVHVAAERERQQKELEGLKRQHESLIKQLANPTFRERAPRQVVEAAEQKLKENLIRQKKIEETLASL